MIYGLIGPACSGKSFVSQKLEKYGFLIINSDKIGHQSLEDNKEKIIQEFGTAILDNQKINRKALSNIVFESKEKLEKLESIVHPSINKIFLEILENNRNKDIIIESAILYKIGWNEYCDKIVYVKSFFITRWIRLLFRYKFNLIKILNIDKIQLEFYKSINDKNIIILYNTIFKFILKKRLNNIFNFN